MNENGKMKKAESLGLPSKKSKHAITSSNSTVGEPSDVVPKKAESTPLSLSDGRSRSAERLRHNNKPPKPLKRRSASPIRPKIEGKQTVVVL